MSTGVNNVNNFVIVDVNMGVVDVFDVNAAPPAASPKSTERTKSLTLNKPWTA